MIPDNIQLTSKDILEKEFKTSMRGYNQEEVDQFLDIIIKDYENYSKLIETLTIENQKLKKQLDEARKQPPQTTGATNFDILKRLSNLEKHVFGSKLYD
ncbi:cell division regulator GpsB [Bacillus andreraoultii]|uniref:cell division regulator GpsB n=1 Tax=Bacillus andreraoultii TaxID=1499685 RepID=UPI00053B06D9|nr:cell division regulator GpsB [Bacillus andreraoultii]